MQLCCLQLNFFFIFYELRQRKRSEKETVEFLFLSFIFAKNIVAAEMKSGGHIPLLEVVISSSKASSPSLSFFILGIANRRPNTTWDQIYYIEKKEVSATWHVNARDN